MGRLYPYGLILFFVLFACTCRQRQGDTRGGNKQPAPPVSDNPIAVPPGDTRYLNHCITAGSLDEESKYKVSPFDQIALFNETIPLRVKVERKLIAGFKPDSPGAEVKFSEPGQFEATAATDKDGIAEATVQLKGEEKNQACYKLTVKEGEYIGRIFSANATDKFLITDIDEVISDASELAVATSKNDKIPAMEGAVELLSEMAKTHRIVYLTARDESLFLKTRDWIQMRNFPPGPILVWEWKLANSFGISRDQQAKYKIKVMEDLKQRFPNLALGIGNRPHDAEAYIKMRVPAFIITKSADKFPDTTTVVKTWAELRPKILSATTP